MTRHIPPEVKRSGEALKLYNFDFEPVIDGDDLTAAGAIAQQVGDGIDGPWAASTDLTIGTPVVGAKAGATRKTLVQVRLSGGVDGKFYKLTVSASGGFAAPHVEPFILEVRD